MKHRLHPGINTKHIHRLMLPLEDDLSQILHLNIVGKSIAGEFIDQDRFANDRADASVSCEDNGLPSRNFSISVTDSPRNFIEQPPSDYGETEKSSTSIVLPLSWTEPCDSIL
jgi:hypothetical protein